MKSVHVALVAPPTDLHQRIWARAKMTTGKLGETVESGGYAHWYAAYPAFLERHGFEKTNRVVQECFHSGHLSVARGAALEFSIDGVSRAAGRQLLRSVVGVAWEEKCLTGDNLVTFVDPGGSGQPRLKISVQRLYDEWTSGERGQARVKARRIRVLNEDTGAFGHAHIADVYSTGDQQVFRVTLADGKAATMTGNHKVLTDQGWLPMRDAVGLELRGELACTSRSASVMVNGRQFGGHDTYRDPAWMGAVRAQGMSLAEIAEQAECSTHTVRSWLKRHKLKFTPKERSHSQLRNSGKRSWNQGLHYTLNVTRTDVHKAILSAARSGEGSNLWRGGVSSELELGRAAAKTHAAATHARNGYTCQECRATGVALHAHHTDPVWNNPARVADPANLISVCVPCHRVIHKSREAELDFLLRHGDAQGAVFTPYARKLASRKLRAHPVQIVSVEYLGVQPTYDLSVGGPYHNFVAGGMVVHNSLRYVTLPPATPGEHCLSGLLADASDAWAEGDAHALSQLLAAAEARVRPLIRLPHHWTEADASKKLFFLTTVNAALNGYRDLIGNEGDSDSWNAEDARDVLPLSVRTWMVGAFSVEALRKFLSDRLCVRAQDEVRHVAGQMRAEAVRAYPWLREHLNIKCQLTGVCPERHPRGCAVLSAGQASGKISWGWEGKV